jgi:hypothetical protein
VASAITSGGARTPEELETLFEDALVMAEEADLAALFAAGAVLRAGGERLARGEAIASVAMRTWGGDHPYLAAPRRVLLARDVALIVGEEVINVARRGGDGAWRFAIMLQVDDGVRREDA